MKINNTIMPFSLKRNFFTFQHLNEVVRMIDKTLQISKALANKKKGKKEML